MLDGEMDQASLPPATGKLYADIARRIGDVTAKIDAIEERAKQELEPLQKALKKLNDIAEAALNKTGTSKLVTEFGSIELTSTRNVHIADSPAFEAWAVENGRLDIFQRRLNGSEVLAILDDFGSLPPGVGMYTKTKIKHSKPKRKPARAPRSKSV